jgi:hypothetical protein
MSSQRRRGFRRQVEFEDRNLFIVIAMEGAETEPRYFKGFALPAKEKFKSNLSTIQSTNRALTSRTVFPDEWHSR